jgi:hypothetical protein
MSNPGGRFAPYRNALTAISGRTGTPLPSLIVSFAILHELTAIVPIVGIFYTARSLGAGERVVNATAFDRGGSIDDQSWANTQLRSWLDEGEQWASRVGRRYGIFGFEKGEVVDQTQTSQLSGKLAGDVANAVLAYGAVKVFLLLSITVGIVTNVCSGAFTHPHWPFVISFPDVLSDSHRAYSIRWPSSIRT